MKSFLFANVPLSVVHFILFVIFVIFVGCPWLAPGRRHDI